MLTEDDVIAQLEEGEQTVWEDDDFTTDLSSLYR